MNTYYVEIIDTRTGAVICEQCVLATGRRDACRQAMTGRSWRAYEAGYTYQEE